MLFVRSDSEELCQQHFCTCVCVQTSWQPRRGAGQMCALVITVIAPFTSSTPGGVAGQHHLDTHTSTCTAITRHGRGLWVVRLQHEAKCDSVYAFTIFVAVSISPFFPGDIFLSLSLPPPRPAHLYPPFSSISLPPLSPAASEIHESLIFPPRLQDIKKKATVCRTKVQRHPLPEE